MHHPIHVVIPMAGHSRRFKAAGFEGPKAMLPVGNATMIEHVVAMFSPQDLFHVVVNEEQIAESPGLIERLRGLAAYVDVTVVPCHEFGPTYSALQVIGIPPDAPVIVSYCDLAVNWDYRKFLRSVAGCDAAAPSFRGFHPASFGTTFYAYMKTEGTAMLKLREKRSFTDIRAEEHASAGIYYFRTWELFGNYGRKLVERKDEQLKEAYVSLLLNDMVDDGLSVQIYEVDHFICLGTPEDYAQYRYWWNYFTRPRQVHAEDRRDVRRINLVPMAGNGSRFRDYGYRVAKPLIQVRRQPMVLRAAGSMPPADRWIFMPRAEDLARHPIAEVLKRFSPDCVVLPVDRATSGQAATCLLAADLIEDDAELTIASCDYEHFYDADRWRRIVEDPSIDGAIWTCRMDMSMVRNPKAFAYCRTDPGGERIVEIVEKQTISDDPGRDPLVVGTFWFRRAEAFKRAAREMIRRNITVNGEHYVGTSINILIEAGAKFVIFDVSQWVSFGDPFELRVLEYWEDYFTATRVIHQHGDPLLEVR